MHLMRVSGPVVQCLAIGSLSIALSCVDNPVEPTIEANPDIRSYVILDAAAALGSAGQFIISPDVAPDAEHPQWIAAARASELASAFLESYGPSFLRFWEQDRGGAIQLAALRAGSRVYPVQSPFGIVPSMGCHPAFTRLFGSFYNVIFLNEEIPQVIIGVSSELTDYGVAADGNIQEPPLTGMDFVHEGISANQTSFRPLSPEQAVAVVARATGAKVTSVPRLIRRETLSSPTIALWRVALDREVPITRTNDSRGATAVLYVGPSGNARFFVAASAQPTSVTTTCVRIDENLEDAGTAALTVPVKPDAVLEFEQVSLIHT